ncbi:class I SAM-dependent methyltransferase [Desulfosporosinus sp. SB140]|uniref:class I SAM-dependent methyltransferase n=1 Tax=Desulfosporosinus paludis TaxID=3115649 RepID=UPI003890D96E
MATGRSMEGEASLPFNRYLTEGYFKSFQWMSYRAQVEAVVNLAAKNIKPVSILEIGVGNGVVSSILRNFGYKLTTVDINRNLKPDIVGSVTELATIFKEQKFDIILCAEVLEHLPYKHFENCLESFSRLADWTVLTLPRSGRYLLLLNGFLKNNWPIDINIRIPAKSIEPEHHWEIDISLMTSKASLKRLMSKYFSVEKQHRVWGQHKHILFVLKSLRQLS